MGSRSAALLAAIAADEAEIARTMARQAERIAHFHDAVQAECAGELLSDGLTGAGWDREELIVALRIGPGEADRRIRTALALRDRLVGTARRLRGGEISWPHAVALADETGALTDDQAGRLESQVLSDPARVTPWDFRLRAKRLAAGMCPDDAALDARQVYEHRRLDAFTIDGLQGALSGRFTPEDLATIATAVDDRAEPGGPDDLRTAEQRRADALVGICAEDLARGRSDSGGRTGNPVRLVVEVPVDAQLAAGTRHPVAEAASVRAVGEALAVSPAPIDGCTLARLSCDAEVGRLVTDPVSRRPLDLARTTRVPSPALRDAVLARDEHHCTFPGCQARRRLEIHHLRHRAHGGPTCSDILATVCPRDHKAVHDGGWRATRTAGGALRWTDPLDTHRPPPQRPRSGPGAADDVRRQQPRNITAPRKAARH